MTDNIFVLGPRASGKTLFILGLWKHILDKHSEGYINDCVVLTDDPNDDGNELTFSDLCSNMRCGRIPERTYANKIVIYEFKGKKLGLIPVKWTFVDYAGEYCNELNESNFTRAVSILSEALNQSPDEIRSNAGTMDFVRFIKSNHADKLHDPEFTRSVILATIYGNFLKAGKVILLVDGDMITDDSDDNSRLSAELGSYMKILNDLENKSKKFAVVVTKTDLVVWKNENLRYMVASMKPSGLSDIPENSKETLAIEKSIFEILCRNPVFKNLINMIDDISKHHFIAVSADAKAKRLERTEDDIVPTDLVPWGFSEVFKFCS